MVYNPNKPAANDTLDNSQIDIQQNFETSNDVFDIDHYPFDDVTTVKGYHKKVSQISYPSAPPVTGANEAVIYAYNLPGTLTDVLQYSKPPLDGVPTPLTNIQNPSAGTALSVNVNVNIFDFTGIAKGLGTFSIMGISGTVARAFGFLYIRNGVPAFNEFTNSNFTFSVLGNVLRVSSPVAGTVVWSIQFDRLEV